MRTFRNGAALALAIILNLSAQTWTNVATGTANDVVDVDFVDPQIGYMIDASDGIFRTTDAGATWNALTTGITGPSCVEFFNRNLGLIGAATGKIFRTTDGGATWTNVHSPGIAETITDIEYETETDVWAISSKGDLYKSVNGGESWTSSASSGAGYASDIHFLTNGLDALELDQNGRILLSQDDGLAWTVTLNVAHPLNDMCFIDNNLGYAVGETDSLFYTTDGGYSWSATDNVFPGENVTAIHFVDKRYGWAGTADGDLYFTEDEGVTFAYQETIQTASRIADIDFVHPNLGMAGAELGSLARFEGVNKFVQITDPEPFDDVTANRFEPLKWRSSGVDKAFVQIYEGGYTTIENDVDAATHSFLFKRNSAGTNRRFVVTDNANSQNSDVSDEPFEMLDPPGTGKWYVDDDATAGGDGSPGSPFATLASAFTAASSGDTIFVMPGKYVPTSTLNGMDYLVMIAPEGPRQTVIDGSSLPSWGITVMRGMWIEGFRFENHANGALLSRVLGGEGTPALVKGNIFANNGIAIVGQSDNLLSAIIVDNVFLKGTDSQILGVFPDAWIFHNVFYDNNSAAAPLIKLETTGITRVWADIRNNVFVGNSTTAADLANLNVTGEQVGNFYEGYNLFYNNSKNALTFYYDPLKSYLVHEASLGADLFVDPQFVDSAGWDFRSWAGTATESAGAVVGTFYPSKPPNIGLLNQSGSILSLEYPVGGENFTQGKSITITWGYSLVSNVDIDFSDDGGDTWTSVTTGLSAANMSYTFTAPTDVESAMCHIRITDADNPQSYDYNQTPFRVVAAQLDLSTFHEHMSLEPGTIHNVTWNSEGVTNVSLDYAPAIAGPWTLVDDNIAASGGSYDWTVPDLEGYNFYFRISNQANPTDGNDVRGPFSLLESFPLELATYDAGAGALYGVELVNATTAYVCGVGAAFRTTDLGETWANVSTGLGSEALYAMDFVNEEAGWAVGSDGAIYKYSNASGVWENQSVAGNNYTHYDVFAIDENRAFVASSNDHILKTTDGGASWSEIFLNSGGQLQSVQFLDPLLGYCATNYGTILRTTDAGETWTQLPPAFDELYEVFFAGENNGWAVGANSTIASTTEAGANWGLATLGAVSSDFADVDFVNDMRGAACGTNGTLLVTDDGGLNWDYAVAQGTNTFTDLDYYDVNTLVAVDASGKVFVLTGGGVEITQPGEGEVFQSGETKPIEFSASPDVTSVAIRLSTDGGATWSDVETAWPRPVGNPVTYDWTIPSSPSDACLVEVANANDSSQSDQSDVFTITSHATTDFLQVAYPNGGEALAVGSTVDISWTHSGFTSLDILFSTDDFASDETTLFSNVAASNGSISWTVPDAVSNQCRIKIVDSNEPFVFDESDNVFSIERTSSGSVELLAPRGHQWWVEGKTYDIRWSASDISLLSIDLTTDAGSTWSEIATNVPAADGAYTWTVPTGMRSSECLIRVEDASDASIYDISQGYFIIGKDTTFLDLFHPNGGEQFSQEGAIYVEWRSANVDSIIAQHSTDLGATWQAIAPKLWADRIVFPWEAPDPTNAFESHLVRIFDHDDFNVADTSERPFVIYQGSPPLELVYPEGGEFFGGGETVNVSWNFNGIDYVDIFFSSDGLGSWRPLAQRVDATGTPYAVQLPELYSADCYIHVVDADRYWIIDRNDMPFTVEGIGAPNVDSAMQNLRGDVSSATLAWSAVNGADSYYLQLARDAAFNDLVLNIQLAETSFDVSGLESGSEYFWRVAAIVQGQQGAWTPAYRLTASLVAPKGLSAAMTSPGSVLLQWEDLTTVESAYIVERRNVNTGEDFAEIFSVAADITKVGDAVDDTSSFVYRVFAVNENTRSDYSNEAAVVKGTLTGGLLDDEHVYFYPNPINPEAGVGTFRFSLSRSADVTITIYDVEGLEVNTLDVGFREEGIELSYEWDCRTSSGRMVDNGTYFYVIETNADERGVGKLSVVR